MAISDFYFLGTALDSNGGSIPLGDNRYAANYIAQLVASGSGNGTDPGSGSLGVPQLHSDLANGLPSGSVHQAGTFCRRWPFSSDPAGYSLGNNNCSKYLGMAILKDSSGGADYPVTDTPSNGTLVAYSLRAFIRTDYNLNGHTVQNGGDWQGSSVGLVVKAINDTDGTGTAPGLDISGRLPAGYCVELGTSQKRSQSTGCEPGISSANPRLIITANSYSSYSTSSDNFIEAASGTYNFGTWYHVRVDVVPTITKDTITVFTAPTTGAGSAHVEGLGSETWTQVAQKEITTSDAQYVPWATTAQNKVGYYLWAGEEGRSTVYGRHSPSIDKFQFLTKDVS